MRRVSLVLLGSGAVVALGLLLFASVASSDAEEACVTALQQELGLSSDEDLNTGSMRTDGDRVIGEYWYGSMRAGSGVMPRGRGEVRCTVRGGEVATIEVEKFEGYAVRHSVDRRMAAVAASANRCSCADSRAAVYGA